MYKLPMTGFERQSYGHKSDLPAKYLSKVSQIFKYLSALR